MAKNKDISKKPHFNKAITFSIFFTVIIISIIVYNYAKESKDSSDNKNQPIIEKGTKSEKEIETNEISIKYEPVVDLSDFMVMNETVSTIYYQEQPIKGIYVTANTAGIEEKLNALIALADETEINAFVIDVKNDNGNITYNMNIPLVDEIEAEYYAIKDIKAVMDKIYDHNIYPIARIVAFKDPYLSSHMTDYAIKNKDGSLFLYKKVSWLSPYNKDAWKYILDVAKEAAKSGFKEIQFDYIRFEATHSLEGANFGDIDGSLTRMDVIVDFLEYAKKELEPYNVKLSADVFGTIITSEVDAKMIGQNYVEMAKSLDIICPMVYPSHYGRGYFGLPSTEPPDLHPYEIIYGSMTDSNTELNIITEAENKPIVRPWLQAFTADYLKPGEYMIYDAADIRKQIQATYDAGLKEWLLWNSGNHYEIDGLVLE